MTDAPELSIVVPVYNEPLTMIGAEILDEPVPASRSERRHSWMTLPLRVDLQYGIERDAAMRHLERNGVETRPLIAGNL